MASADVEAALRAAVAHHRAGRLAEAERDYRAILAADPTRARAARNLSAILLERGDLDAAEALLAQACADSPDEPQLLANLGFVQLRQDRAAAARDSLERALALAPDDGAILTNLGTALRALGQREAAAARYRQALDLDPQNEAARVNLGGGGTGDALKVYLAAAQADRSPETLAQVGVNLSGLNRYDEALKWLDEAVELADARGVDAEQALTRHKRSFVRLATGDFTGGWDDYERRWQLPAFVRDNARLKSPLRIGEELFPSRESLRGADVLVMGEQGPGDEIMFASMLPDLAAEAGRVHCVCDPRLVGLFQTSFPGVTFAGPAEPRPAWRVLPMGGLGRLYRNAREDFPGTPYLRPWTEVRDRWAVRLGPRPAGLRIGVSWRGGLKQTRSEQRSLPLAELARTLDLPGCELVSLQYGEAYDEVAAVNAGRANPIRMFAPRTIDDFEELAGLVANLDVVVSVQTTLIHLAGAIGAPCLVMVPHHPEWRYGAAGSTMPWYGSVRLMRQPSPGAWEPVLAEVRAALEASGRRP